MSAWIIIVLTVATLLTVYLGWRMVEPLPIGRKRKVLAWLLIGLLLFGHRLTWVLHRSEGLEGFVCGYIDWVGFTFLGFVSILIFFMFCRDIPGLFRSIGTKISHLFVRRSKRPYFIEPNLERRRFMLNASNGLILAATVPLTGYGVLQARKTPTVVHNELSIAGLSEGLDGFTIAQVTDTHIGPTIRHEWARKVVDEVNALGADLIVHTGDMVDGSVDGLRREISPMGDFSAPYGVWYCTGNHEYYSGVHQWLAEARRLGMTPLVNEHKLIDTGKGRILLGGVSDYRSNRLEPAHVSSPSAAMKGAPEHDVSILLAHQPQSVFEAAKAGFDIQLSGHTHGGQYFPYNFAVHLFQPYVKGLHLHENTLLYVSMGTGYWGPPVRLGTVPEITLHTLRRA